MPSGATSPTGKTIYVVQIPLAATPPGEWNCSAYTVQAVFILRAVNITLTLGGSILCAPITICSACKTRSSAIAGRPCDAKACQG